MGSLLFNDVARAWNNERPSTDERPRATSRQTTSNSLYGPLEKTEHIRLLRCVEKERRASEVLECELFEAGAPQESSVDYRYSAISYVWGHGRAISTISCNGVHCKIGANLYAALQQIWSKAPRLVLWADALCINQDDKAEKASQVASMGRVFSHAVRTIVWLGEETKTEYGINVTADAFKILGTALNARNRPGVAHDDKDAAQINIRDTMGLYIEHYAPVMADVTDREWFYRLWTFHEIILASRAFLLCENYLIQWDDFLSACQLLAKISPAWAWIDDRFLDVKEAQTVLKSGRSTLTRLLVASRTREASDLRDKIFACLALLKDPAALGLEVKYDTSIRETFTAAARACLEIEGETSILHGAGLNRFHSGKQRPRNGMVNLNPKERANQLGLPSWVPDWSNLQDMETVFRWLNRRNSSHGVSQARLGAQLRDGFHIRLSGFLLGRCAGDRRDVVVSEVPGCIAKHINPLSKTGSLSMDDLLSIYREIEFHRRYSCHELSCKSQFDSTIWVNGPTPEEPPRRRYSYGIQAPDDWICVLGNSRVFSRLRPMTTDVAITFRLVEQVGELFDLVIANTIPDSPCRIIRSSAILQHELTVYQTEFDIE